MTPEDILKVRQAELEQARTEMQKVQANIRDNKARAWDLSIRIGTLKADIDIQEKKLRAVSTRVKTES